MAHENEIIVGRIYERKTPITVTVQRCDEIGVAFTYEGVNTFYLGHDEFLRRFELPLEDGAYDTLRAENERLRFARRDLAEELLALLTQLSEADDVTDYDREERIADLRAALALEATS